MADLTKSMKQSPWKVNYSSASQGIPHILWNPKFQYCIHNNPTLVHVLSQINAINALPSYFLKIHFNIILPPMPRSSKLSLYFMFLTKTLYAPLMSLVCAIFWTHLILLDFITDIIWLWLDQQWKLKRLHLFTVHTSSRCTTTYSGYQWTLSDICMK